MRKRLFDDNWSFFKTGLNVSFDEAMAKIQDFYEVCIPHDYLIYNGKDLYEDSIGWYFRKLSLNEIKSGILNYKIGNRIFLYFDGVYMDSTLFVNGKEVMQWKYGYSSFYADITEYLHTDNNGISMDFENEIVVRVVHQSPNSRWYSGAGIYRDVYVLTAEETFIPFGGLYVSNRKQNEMGDYLMQLQVELGFAPVFMGSDPILGSDPTKTPSTPDVVAVCRLFDKFGEEVCKIGEFSEFKEINASGYELNSANKDNRVRLFEIKTECAISTPHIWDIDDPYCYTLKVDIIRDEEIIDSESVTVGFKNVEFTVNEGFFLNGRHIKLNGVCEHHDFGCLGSAYHEDAMVRKFETLKKMGVNALRTSHNMPASNLMELADRMGILVVSEAFDMWARPKTEYDYGRFFKDWVERDVRSWIRRDRNHPSIIMWSIGNEIYDTHAGEEGLEITKQLMELVISHDPNENGKVTLGSNYMPWENTQKCAELYKLAGYNYGAKYYNEHHEKYKDWVIYGSETASIVMSRGVYRFPFSQSVMADDDEQCSALGNSNTSWGADSVEICIAEDKDVKFSLGQFIWTGFDYIGEPTPYHTRNSYFGQIDTAGFPKDSYYVFMAEWTDVKTNPMVHIFPYWDFNRGQALDIRACSNGASIELLVNGKSKGIKKLNHSYGTDFTATWSVDYEPGEITAVAYDNDGNEIARETRKSFGDSKKLVINTNKSEVYADGRSLVFAEITVLDENGNPVENAMDYVSVKVEGNAYLWGLDNGDSTDFDEYKCTRRKLFNGKLLAVVKAGRGQTPLGGQTSHGGQTPDSNFKIIVESEGLERAEAEIKLIPTEIIEGASGLSALQSENNQIKARETVTDRIPARKIEIICDGDQSLSPLINDGEPSLSPLTNAVNARVKLYPENTTDTEVIFKAVNNTGIEVNFVSLEQIDKYNVKIVPKGDGNFWLRAMSKGSDDKIHLISQLQFSISGMGEACLNPYEFIAGGLYSESFGDVGNGNEKGFSTSNDGVSGVCFKNIDFGEVGSDEITLPVFTLSNDAYPFKLYDGTPENGTLIMETSYQKNYIWNVYQEETFKLPYRLKGIKDLSITFDNKVHVKGFIFKKYEKAFEKLYAAQCNGVYGDQFEKREQDIINIGNNVSIEFENMDFSALGSDPKPVPDPKQGSDPRIGSDPMKTAPTSIIISGRSVLEKNSIHIHFTDEDGNDSSQIVEFSGCKDYNEQKFDLKPINKKCKVSFVFLPGSKFDFEYFRFS